MRRHGHWERGPEQRSLADSRVAVLGYGSIGRALAVRLLACGAVVTAVASAPRDDDLVGSVVTAADVDWAAQHVVIVVLPLTSRPGTWSTPPSWPGSPTARSSSTSAAGRCWTPRPFSPRPGRLRFALDVTDPEPLPDGHPLWSAPSVLITPHVAGGTTAMLPRMAALLRDQLTAYVAGQPLRNVVDTDG